MQCSAAHQPHLWRKPILARALAEVRVASVLCIYSHRACSFNGGTLKFVSLQDTTTIRYATNFETVRKLKS